MTPQRRYYIYSGREKKHAFKITALTSKQNSLNCIKILHVYSTVYTPFYIHLEFLGFIDEELRPSDDDQDLWPSNQTGGCRTEFACLVTLHPLTHVQKGKVG